MPSHRPMQRGRRAGVVGAADVLPLAVAEEQGPRALAPQFLTLRIASRMLRRDGCARRPTLAENAGSLHTIAIRVASSATRSTRTTGFYSPPSSRQLPR